MSRNINTNINIATNQRFLYKKIIIIFKNDLTELLTNRNFSRFIF